MAAKRPRRLLVTAVAVVIAALVAWIIPAIRARIKAAGVLAAATDIPFARPWARSVSIETRELAPGVIGDMYVGDDEAPILLFVPGATREGRRDERVRQAATALAEAGRRVFVPELALYKRKFERGDIDRLGAAIDALAGDEPIGVVAFSYGGSFSLIAASEPGRAEDLSFVAVFGAYFDLAHVLQGVTTRATILDGEDVPFETVPQAREIMTEAAVELADRSYRGDLREALERNDGNQLEGDAKAVYDALTNDEPARAEALFAELPPEFKDDLAYFSPVTHIEDIQMPVFIMQSKKDAATPWPEAVLLERALDQTRLVMLNHFSHVDPPSFTGWLTDGPQSWRFVSWILAEQE